MRGMKSAAAAVLLLCACCRGEEVKGTNVTQVTGSDVTLFADLPLQPTEINWLKNGIRIVDLEKGKQPEFYTHYNIRDRVTADLEKKTFILRDVTPGDSGTYRAVLLVNGPFQNADFNLRVLDPVCNVSVKNTTVMSMTVGSNVTLRCSCSSAGAEPSRYEWRNVSHRVSDQQIITVSMKYEQQIFSCVASNDVSNSTASFTVPKIPYFNPIVIIIPILIIIIIIIVIVCLYKRGYFDRFLKRFRPQKPTDPETEQNLEERKGLKPEEEADPETEQNLGERKGLKPEEEAGGMNSAENGEETKNQKNGKMKESEDSAENSKETDPMEM